MRPGASGLAASLPDLDARLGALRDTSGVPAMAVAVLAGPPGAARVVWSRAYGVLNARTGTLATVDSPFMLASASKLVTGLVVMQAVDAGRLALDAPIGPPFAWGGSPDVTLRRLATHTSGIVDTDAVDDAYAPGDSAEPRDAFLAEHLGPGGDAFGGAPGAFAYSNTGIALAASLAEAATGVPFEALSQRGLFDPLGVTHTGWFLHDFPDTLAVASPHDADGTPLAHYGYPTWPDGQLRASVVDAAQLLALFMNGGRAGETQLLRPETVAEMLRPQVPAAPDGQGLFVQWKRGLAGHMGGDGGVRTFVFFDPETHVGAVVLVNQDGPRATAVAVEAVRQTLRNPASRSHACHRSPVNALTRRPCSPTLAALVSWSPMRPLLLLNLLALAACDSSGVDPAPYTGVVEVSLAPDADGRTGLLLVAVDDTGCASPLVVETDATTERLDVRVVGIARRDGPTCLAIIPASVLVPLPFASQGRFPVSVAHRSATDEYAYSIGFAGERLDAVRTSTTRLGTP